MAIINMTRKKLSEPFGNEKGVVLAAVLIFISLILPVTLIILNTIEIETMLPTNEGYSKIALHEADKGLDIALAALMEDNQDGFYGDYIVDPTRHVPLLFPLQIEQDDTFWVPGMARGRHDIDYLAESWARHPDNFTFFMAEHSRENELHTDPPFNPDPPGNPDEYSVPTRWIMMNVPFGMDDHGERTFNEHYNTLSDILLPMDTFPGAGQVTPINAYAADTGDTDEEQAPAVYVTENWIFSSSHPDYIKPKYIARPASYFRNTNPADAAGSVVYNNEVEDALVYDGRLDDIDDNGMWGEDDKNQYLNNPVLQEAVLNSQWSNLHFGPGNMTARNKEYKPLPGSVTQYPVGSSGDDYLPAWFQSIVSDESARFNLNTVLNIIYQGANYDYNSEGTALEVPLVRYDDYGQVLGDYEILITDDDHPNFSNYLLARDMITALLMEDRELTSLDRFNLAQQKAQWILRNMLIVREKLDLNYDANGDGIADEIDITYPDPAMTTLDDVPMNGRGRMGDATRANQGTWQIYNNPKDFLNDPGRFNYDDFPEYTPLAMEDFGTLNRTCTVYTYDTEHTADAEASSFFADHQDYRINFNACNEDDYFVNVLFDKWLGVERTRSLFRWRDGLVDLNADGDLNDEYILQPVKDPATAEAETNMTTDSQPVSQITYRERNHFNFQEPANPAYPAMLNIPDLGTLAMVPMSVRDTQIIASIDGVGLSTFDPTNPGAPGIPIPNTDDGLACDIDFSGTKLMFDTLNALEDLYEVEIPRGDNLTQMSNAEGYHPSYNSEGTQFVYVDKDVGMGGQTLSVYDIPSDSRVSTNWNGPVTLATMSIPLGPGGDFFEAASPDWSPIANTIAFAGGGELDFAGDPLTEHTDIYVVRLDGPTAGIPDNITNLPDGFFALYPDFSPDGEWIAYTLINFNELFPPPIGNAFMIVIQNLVDNRRELVHVTSSLFMLAPDWDPYGNRLCFMGVPVFGGSTDIWTVSRGGTDIPINLTSSPQNELFPSWGWGMTLVATQGDGDPGGARGTAVIYPAGPINPDADPWDETYREQLAQVIQEASLAFREGLAEGDEQNWRLMDLPVMPQHMVDPLQICADVLSFRPSYTPVLQGEDPFTFIPQAYPGRVNINTAPRSVLRALFLLMFQGAVYQDSNNDNHGSAPMVEGIITMRATPINLAYDRTSNTERLYALAIADTYANQVDEYRRWVYNNRSKSFTDRCYDNLSHSFSITRETVPDNLIFPVAGGDIGKNFRANPFAPYDLDDNPFTKDRPLYDPEPPFRNIADLFNVALYNGELPVNWLLEGYDNDYGPDPEETVDGRHVVPTAYDQEGDDEATFRDVYEGPNALAIWGPIYQTEFPVTFGFGYANDDQDLSPYEAGDSSVPKNPETRYYKQQRFRLFSADDFKWISPYITTRSYVYRVESRGTVRVANGTNKLDVSRDKFWIVDFGAENYLSYETTSWEFDNTEIIDQRVLMNNSSNQPYAIKAFEEVPVDGIRLTRGSFTPPKTK